MIIDSSKSFKKLMQNQAALNVYERTVSKVSLVNRLVPIAHSIKNSYAEWRRLIMIDSQSLYFGNYKIWILNNISSELNG